MNTDQDASEGNSPSGEDMHKRGYTDRTSRFAFLLERWLRKETLVQHWITRLLRMDENLARVLLMQRWGERKQSISLWGYGYLAAPGVPLEEWPYPYTGGGHILRPRLVISTVADPGDFGVSTGSDREGFSKVTKNELWISSDVGSDQLHHQRREQVKWSYTPLRLLCVLEEDGTLFWDWTDFDHQPAASFHERVLCLHRSAANLVYKTIPRLFLQARQEDPTSVMTSGFRFPLR